MDQGQVAKGQLVARTSSTAPAQQQSVSDKMKLFGKNLLEIVLLYQQIEAFLVKQAILCDKKNTSLQSLGNLVIVVLAYGSGIGPIHQLC